MHFILFVCPINSSSIFPNLSLAKFVIFPIKSAPADNNDVSLFV